MQGCVTWLLLFAFAVFVLVSVLRWFEQTSDAVDAREWNKLALLIAIPFAAWFYRAKVGAGRPTSVPRHDPVRGFGPLPKSRPAPQPMDKRDQVTGPVGENDGASVIHSSGLTAEPPPGTPKEFLGMPVIASRANKPMRPAVDPEKLAKLKQKMREQGMLPDDNTPPT